MPRLRAVRRAARRGAGAGAEVLQASAAAAVQQERVDVADGTRRRSRAPAARAAARDDGGRRGGGTMRLARNVAARDAEDQSHASRRTGPRCSAGVRDGRTIARQPWASNVAASTCCWRSGLIGRCAGERLLARGGARWRDVFARADTLGERRRSALFRRGIAARGPSGSSAAAGRSYRPREARRPSAEVHLQADRADHGPRGGRARSPRAASPPPTACCRSAWCAMNESRLTRTVFSPRTCGRSPRRAICHAVALPSSGDYRHRRDRRPRAAVRAPRQSGMIGDEPDDRHEEPDVRDVRVAVTPSWRPL